MIRQSTQNRRPKKRARTAPVWTVEPLAAGHSRWLSEIRARLREIEAQLLELDRPVR